MNHVGSEVDADDPSARLSEARCNVARTTTDLEDPSQRIGSRLRRGRRLPALGHLSPGPNSTTPG
jgi:hypothetical protein